MLHSYSSKELSTCLQTEASSKRIVFVGDSVGRTSFYSLAKLVDPYFSTVSDKHSDRIVQGPDGITIEFYWDPFLNTSATTALLSPDRSTEAQSATAAASAPPALLVFSTGMWHMRYMPGEAGLQAYATTLDRIFDATLAGGEHIRRLGNTANAILADEVVVMPVQLIVESLLSPERAAGMSNQSIRRFNDLLRQKEATAVHGRYSGSPTVVEVPWSFNEMLGPDGVEPAETSVEGLHLPDAFARHQINILLNLRCNDVMPKKFPRASTISVSLVLRPTPADLIVLCFRWCAHSKSIRPAVALSQTPTLSSLRYWLVACWVHSWASICQVCSNLSAVSMLSGRQPS